MLKPGGGHPLTQTLRCFERQSAQWADFISPTSMSKMPMKDALKASQHNWHTVLEQPPCLRCRWSDENWSEYQHSADCWHASSIPCLWVEHSTQPRFDCFSLFGHGLTCCPSPLHAPTLVSSDTDWQSDSKVYSVFFIPTGGTWKGGTVLIGYYDYLGTWPKNSHRQIIVTGRQFLSTNMTFGISHNTLFWVILSQYPISTVSLCDY